METARLEYVSGTVILRHKLASVEFGRFHSENPEAWIFQEERYLYFYRIETDQ